MTSAAPANLDTPPTDARFLRNFWRLVRWALPVRFRYFGIYEYRIARAYPSAPASTIALDLQATEATAALGLDDIAKVEAWPGVAGAVPAATPGARVLVSFIGGDEGRPLVMLWAPSGDPGWRPATLTIDTVGTLFLGPSCSEAVTGTPQTPQRFAREGDTYSLGAATGPLTFISTPQSSGPTSGQG